MRELIDALIEKLKPLTHEQIITALQYAIEGNSHWSGEKRPKGKKKDDDESSVALDDDASVHLGVLHDGLVLGLGTIAELKSLTTSTLHALISYKSCMEYGETARKSDRDKALVDYYGVLDEIKEAHREKA